MRILMKVSLPVETANALARKGSLGQTIGAILEDLKPECAYFTDIEGERAGYVVVNIDEAHQIPKICEPWFLALDASIQLSPVMTAEDLQKAGPEIERAAKKYGAQAR